MITGGYVRHRDRMVRQSVREDLRNTLIAFRWMSGTTSRPVVSPFNPSAGWAVVTTTADQVLKLAGVRADGTTPAEVVLIDYFPEVGGNDDAEGRSRKTEVNTLAVDAGQTGDAEFMELGSNMMLQPYTFTMALYAGSDAIALALLNDLRDRYQGRIVSDDFVDLFDYNADGFSNSTDPVVRMEVDVFTYEQNVEVATPADVHLYYGRLQLSDYVDPSGVPSGAADSGEHVMALGAPELGNVDHGAPHFTETVVVGEGDVLGDGDDATYVVLRSDFNEQDLFLAAFTPDVDFTTLRDIIFDVRYRVAGDNPPAHPAVTVGIRDVGASSSILLPSMDLNGDGSVHTLHFSMLDYVTGIYGAELAVPYLSGVVGPSLGALGEYAAFLYLDSYDGSPWSGVATIYEFSMTFLD